MNNLSISTPGKIIIKKGNEKIYLPPNAIKSAKTPNIIIQNFLKTVVIFLLDALRNQLIKNINAIKRVTINNIIEFIIYNESTTNEKKK